VKKSRMVSLVIVVAAAIILGIVLRTKHEAFTNSAQIHFPAGTKVGVWDWQQPDRATAAQDAQAALSLKQQGVTEVYIDISAYNDYDELTTPDRPSKLSAFTVGLRTEVAALHRQGISAQALAGSTRWGDPDLAYIPSKLLDYAHTYNASAASDEQLAGIQFDIEFYSDPHFSDNAAENTRNYLSLTQQLIAQRAQLFGASHFLLGFTAVDWLDGRNASFVPNISIANGPTEPPLQQLLDQLKGQHDTYIALMAYRNHADGSDGTIERAQSDMDMIQNVGGGKVKVLLGQETTKVSPGKLSFYGMSKQDVSTSAARLQEAFGTYSSFAGFTINDEQGYLALH
jgi:hypothetical protein